MTNITPLGGGGAFSAASLVSEAKKFLGDAYVYGAAGPTTFDCSGLVQYALTRLGVKNVPRTSEAQWAWVSKISVNDLQPGDLVFGNFPGETSPGHVVIYAGNDQVIDAPETGEKVQQISLSDAFAGGTIVGYGRVPDSTQPAGGGITGSSNAASDVQLTGFSFGAGADDATKYLLSPIKFFTNLGSEADDTAKGILDISNDIKRMMDWAVWLFEPSSWLRVGAFFAGVTLLIMGGVTLAKATGAIPQVTPIPIPV